jgi:hypothetical protein
LLTDPTVVLRRQGGVMQSVKGDARSGSAKHPERARGARISFVATVSGRRSPVRAAVAGARGAQHPVGDGSKVGPVLLESFCQPVALVHRSVDPFRALNVTSRLRAAGCLLECGLGAVRAAGSRLPLRSHYAGALPFEIVNEK